MAMSDYTKIPRWVKGDVWQRDHERCVVCLRWVQIECACSHVVRRSQGGMGIPENIVCHCPECHRKYDSYDAYTVKATMDYIQRKYPDWSREAVTYKKHQTQNSD